VRTTWEEKKSRQEATCGTFRSPFYLKFKGNLNVLNKNSFGKEEANFCFLASMTEGLVMDETISRGNRMKV